MSLQVTIFQHSAESPPGSTLTWLEKNKFSYRIHFWGTNQDISSYLAESDFLIILGGPQNVDQEDKYPWLREEKRLILNFLKSRKPTLGLCLGGQLMAEVLGAVVKKHSHLEVGWHNIEMNPSVSNLIPETKSLSCFQWHGYHFQTPAGCKRFGTNSITESQGFVYEDFGVGTQFHPETTKFWVEACSKENPYPKGTYVQSPEEMIKLSKAQPDLQEWYFDLLDRMTLELRRKKGLA